MLYINFPLTERVYYMDCRLGCGACCIAPSITTAIPGMPNGKLAGEPCVQLDENRLCKLFGDPSRPALCHNFKATIDVCGHTDNEAMWLINNLEESTRV